MDTYCIEQGLGKPVLYLHGWGASGDIFKSVAGNLQGFTNYMIDFAGFGNSPPPPKEGFTVFDYANQIADFLAKKKLTEVTIVAHSFGCRVALILAATRPELVKKMLLFAPAGLRRFSLKRWCKIRLYKLKKRLCKNKNFNAGSNDYQATPNALKSTFVKVVNQDLSAYARKTRCKTLIIAATNDTAVPLADAKRLHKLVKNSEFTTVCGDHFALFYAPAAFAKIIELFAEE